MQLTKATAVGGVEASQDLTSPAATTKLVKKGGDGRKGANNRKAAVRQERSLCPARAARTCEPQIAQTP